MNRVRPLREARSMRREELAARVGISFSYVQRIESPGEAAPNPSLTVARRIADVLGVTVDEVFPAAGVAPAATGTEG